MKVLTLGTFDLWHTGHVNLMARCRSIAGEGQVIVGLNTDEFVARYKGHRPVIAYADRKVVVEACKYVDRVVENNQALGSAVDVITAVAPDAIVVGDDWRSRDYPAQLGVTQDWLDDCGVAVIYVPYTQHISSSQIRGRM